MKNRLHAVRARIRQMSRTQSIALLSILILLTLSFGGVTTYYITKNNNTAELESANFTIDNFDILDGGVEFVLIGFRLNISNYNSGGENFLIKGDHIKITLINNSVPLAELQVDSGSGGFKKSQYIETTIELDPENDNPLLEGLIDNILSGLNFKLDFIGEVYYKVANLISDSFKFENDILFVVNNSALTLEINEIFLPSIDSLSATLDVRVLNPFSSNFLVKGLIFTHIEDINLGEINLQNGLMIQSGNHNYTVDWNLSLAPISVITEFLKRFNSSIELETDLELSINDLSISASPNLQLGFAENLVEFQILEVSNFNTNQTDGSLSIDFSMELISNLPLELNISSILMKFNTLTDTEIGDLNWQAPGFITIPAYSSSLVNNVSFVFTGLSAQILVELILSSAIKISEAIINLLFFGEEIEITFDIPRIEI